MASNCTQLLQSQLHPNGTAIEGEWQPVFAAIAQTLQKEVASVRALLWCQATGTW